MIFTSSFHELQKILKGNWTKKSEANVKKHDEKVATNWDLLKKGKLDLPPHLKEHLIKFTNRKLNVDFCRRPNTDTKKEIPKVKGQFLEIISSYERLKNKNMKDEVTESDDAFRTEFEQKKSQRETYTLTAPDEYVDKRHVPLSVLVDKLEHKKEVSDRLNEDEELMLYQLKHKADNLPKKTVENPTVDVSKYKAGTTNLTTVSQNAKDYSFLDYPQKITIPREIKKMGYTYKLNDCFYDSDGLFLYRVPGMDK